MQGVEILRFQIPRRTGDCPRMLFDEVLLWLDGTPRPGPENMAVDEWLLETSDLPVVRVYRWAGDWASIGYFGKIAEARALFPGLGLVRRWTGGGMVDHRDDWTYTLVAPRGTSIAGMKGDGSYHAIHSALAAVLPGAGISARLATGGSQTGASLCFENPVNHDLVGPAGQKIAGAGQRRTKRGLLHQGSVAVGGSRHFDQNAFATAFVRTLSRISQPLVSRPDPRCLARYCEARYDSQRWSELR